MRRREFITLLGCGAAAWPLAARAQNGDPPRVGFVYPGPRAASGPRIEAILSGLRVAGFRAPTQVELVMRTADGEPARIPRLIDEIISSKVNLIIANGPPVLHAARAVTTVIPVVALDLETDPVASGIAASLARPGGNVTGVFLDFQVLVELNPRLSRAAVLWDPLTGRVQLDSVQNAAKSLNIELDTLEVRVPSDFDRAFATAKRGGAGAMVMLSSPLIAPNVPMLADLAAHHELAAITLFPDFARSGGLLAYGPNLLGMYRRVGVLGGKVLQGFKPAELPIERPTKFELVLNLRTANALGIPIPESLLLRADEVIE